MDDTTVTVILVTVIVGIFLIGGIVRYILVRYTSLPIVPIYPFVTEFFVTSGTTVADIDGLPTSTAGLSSDSYTSTPVATANSTIPEGTYPSSVPLAMIVPWTMRKHPMEWLKLSNDNNVTSMTFSSSSSSTTTTTTRINDNSRGTEKTFASSATIVLHRSNVWEKASFGTVLELPHLQLLLTDILLRMEEAQNLLASSPLPASTINSAATNTTHTHIDNTSNTNNTNIQNLIRMIKVDVERTPFLSLLRSDTSPSSSSSASSSSSTGQSLTIRYQIYLTTILLAWLYRHPKLRYIQALSIIGSFILQVYLPMELLNRSSSASASFSEESPIPYQLCKSLLLFEYVTTSYLGDLLLPPAHTGLYHSEIRHMSAILDILAYWDPLLHIKLTELTIEPELWTTNYLTTFGLNNVNRYDDGIGILDTLIICGHREKIRKHEMVYPDYYRHSPRRDSRYPLFLTVAILMHYRVQFLAINDTNESLRVLQDMKEGTHCAWTNVRYSALLLWTYSGALLGSYAPHALTFPLSSGANDERWEGENSSVRRTSIPPPERSLSTVSMESFSGIIGGMYDDEEAQILLAEAIEVRTDTHSSLARPNRKRQPERPRTTDEEEQNLRILQHVQRYLHHIGTVNEPPSSRPRHREHSLRPETKNDGQNDDHQLRTALLSTDTVDTALYPSTTKNTVTNRNYIVPIITLYDIVTFLVPFTVFSSSFVTTPSPSSLPLSVLPSPGSKITYINLLPSSSMFSNSSFITQGILNGIIERNLQEMDNAHLYDTSRGSESVSSELVSYITTQGKVIDISLQRLFPFFSVPNEKTNRNADPLLPFTPTIDTLDESTTPLDYHEFLGCKTSLPLTDLCSSTGTPYDPENLPRTNELLRQHTRTYASALFTRQRTLMVILLHKEIPLQGVRLFRDLLWRNGIPYVCGIRLTSMKKA